MNNYHIQSEYQLSHDEITNSRLTEYVQSVIVSSENKYKRSRKDPHRLFMSIQRDINNLHLLITKFYFSWATGLSELQPELNEETQKILTEAQLLFSNVRGQRYQVHETEYLEKLLRVHDSAFKKEFNLSTNQIIEGIKKLQYSLSQGKIESLNKIGELFDNYTLQNESDDTSTFFEQNRDAIQKHIEELLGPKRFDVLTVTGWPRDFVDLLSFGINEVPEFFEKGEFQGWPIIDLPIQKRPFIKLLDGYYCFDYYSLMDNFYRVLQKAIKRKTPDYNWSDAQKEASEQMVADVFSSLLPGCIVYRDNYYPKGHGKRAENDILITYLDTLFIIEVKAGSFVYTSPILDFQAHITSYKNLIEKADHQCKNTYDYLFSRSLPAIYNEDNTLKTNIDTSHVAEVFMISVTIDNINAFAARAEKMSFLQLKSNAISISIDDLMVYRDYFESPLVFLHFLKQRRQATQEPNLALNDELDHLGLYIEHNMYCLQLKNYPKDSFLVFDGYREELDKYFSALYHPTLHPEKPTQQHPDTIKMLLLYLEQNDVPQKRAIANYLLDFSIEAKNELDRQIKYTLERQKETKRILAVSTAGNSAHSLRYTLFIEQPHVNSFSSEYMQQYVLSTLLWNEEQYRTMIKLSFDTQHSLKGIEYKIFSINNIAKEERESLLRLAEDRAKFRVTLALQKLGRIEDDLPCPCGSSKKYSLCCRDRYVSK